MTVNKIKDRLAEMCTLFEFTYNGKDGNIDPCYSPEKGNEFLLSFDGSEQIVDSVEKVMSAPFIGGQSLNDIYDKITITDW